MEQEKLLFIRKESPYEGRTISFYFNEDKDVVILDSDYPKKSIVKKFSNREGKCDAVSYGIRLNKSETKRKKYYVSVQTMFHLNDSSDKIVNSRWNLKQYSFKRETIKKYLIDSYVSKNLQVPSFTLLGYSEKNSPERAIYTFCYREENNGSSTYYEILDEMGIIGDVIYRTHSGKTLRSYAEFVLFSFLHFNNIDFIYEDSNINGCIPDFKLSNNTYIELVGYDKTSKSSHAILYHERLDVKKEKYLKNNINVFYLDITKDVNPKDSVYNQLLSLFPNIKTPNIFDYFQEFVFSGKKYIEHLKDLGRKFAKGELTSDLLHKYYQPDYLKILNEYGSVYNFCETYMNMDELLNTPKSYGYFYSLDNCNKWLNFLENKHHSLPTISNCKSNSKFSPLYSIYRIYRPNEFCNGGLFEKYNTPYKNTPKEIYEITNTITGEKFNGIYDAYIKSNPTETLGEFYDNLCRGKGVFVSAVQSGVRIKNTKNNKVYQSIRECVKSENINYNGFQVYLHKLYKGNVSKSKYSHLVPLTADFVGVDNKNYIKNRYESMTKFSDDEVKIIHNMIKKGKTEKDIETLLSKSFARGVFYKSLVYQSKIKEFFNEEITELTVNVLYPSNMKRTNYTTEEFKDIISLSVTKAIKKYNISTGTFYKIKNKVGKYSLINYK
jgi:hypothetical protein